MFEQYDPPTLSPDLPGEVAAAASSPLEISNFYSRMVTPGGIAILGPEWTLYDLMPLISLTMTEVLNLGNTYDYMPDTLSRVLYGTHDLWPLLLDLNNASCRAEFTGPNFIVVKQGSAPLLLQAFALAAARAAQATANGIPSYGDLTLHRASS
jgi:hypothetical protein